MTQRQYKTKLTGVLNIQIKPKRMKTALQRKINFGKSVLKARHSVEK